MGRDSGYSRGFSSFSANLGLLAFEYHRAVEVSRGHLAACGIGQQGLPRRAGWQLQSPGEKQTLDPVSLQSPTLSRLLCLRVVFYTTICGNIAQNSRNPMGVGRGGEGRKEKRGSGESRSTGHFQTQKRGLHLFLSFLLFFNFSFPKGEPFLTGWELRV